jgi:tRNA nucleotidyltransferase (CCA-adding enzyme)
MVNKIGKDRTSELLDLKEADAMAQSLTYLPTKLVVICNARRILSELEAEEACFGLKDLAVNGKDLMDNGFKQGKLIGETLKYLLDKVLDEVLPNDREVLLREATSYKNSKVV